MSLFLPFLFFVLLLSKRALAALVNVSIDDTSPLITYLGTWEPDSAHLSSLDFGGAHTVSADLNASAVLRFTGVAVYFLSPRWPYAVTTQLTLDDDNTVVLDLTDHNASSTPPGGSESVPSSIVWSATGLTNGLHTVVVRMASGGQFAVVDGFIITVVDSDLDSSMPTTSPSSSSPIPSPSFTSIHGHSHPAALRLPLLRILAIVVGVLIFLLACVVVYRLWMCQMGMRRRKDGHGLPKWAVDGIPVPFVVGADERGLGSRATPVLRDSESARSTLVGIVTVVEDSDKLSSSESDFVSAPGVTLSEGPRLPGPGPATTLASAFKALAVRKTHIKTDEEEGASAGEGLSLQVPSHALVAPLPLLVVTPRGTDVIQRPDA